MDKTTTVNSDEISIQDIVNKIKSGLQYLLGQWWKLIIASMLGGAIGFSYSLLKPVTYSARLNFLVEEGKNSGSGLASLAGQFGFDLGGLSGGSSLLSGDNVLVFLKSKNLTRETLLTQYDSSGTYSLADRYAEINNLRGKWKSNSKIAKDIFFPVNGKIPGARLHDSLLQVITDQILKKELFVEKPDKKSSFVQVTTVMRDELLAKYYCERLVKLATERFIHSKISRQTINVNRLQRRADSIGALLNNKTYATAVAQEKILDINPAFKTSTVIAEVTGRDKLMLTTIYGEVIKNLEISKAALSQETPAIEIVDTVDLPLKVNKTGKVFAFLVGAFLAMFVFIVFLTAKIFLSHKFGQKI